MIKWVRALGLSLVLLGGMAPFDDAWAKRTSSGGYSRPSSSSSSKSYSAPSRTPSSSGGYTRPRTPSTDTSSYSSRTPSAGDQAVSRSGSGGAYDRYKASREPAPSAGPTRPSTGSGERLSYDLGSRRAGWYGGRGWSPPAYAYGRPSFGMWDALFLWFMLDTLTTPSHAAFFHDNQDDPGYKQWRAEAEERAKTDSELRGKLDTLDRELAARAGQPRSPGAVPGDVPSDQALAETDSGFGMLWLIPVLGGVLFILWRARRRPGRSAPQPAKGDANMDILRSAGNYVRGKMGGEAYKPSLFRVGMTVTLDPTPFLLAAGSTKVPTPEISGSDLLTGIDAVGTVRIGDAALYRLRLPDGKSFLQLHLDAGGQPDECRFFAVIDEVQPADEDEWAFWLDRAEGMIGWPEFQTKDGKGYARVWNPGSARIEPKVLQESVDTVRGMRIRNEQAMLYGADTGLQPPAPAVEYILVSAVKEGDSAWIEIAAGIDINPASLSLA